VRQNGAGEATRTRLMRVAERLVARSGYDAVSIRDITSAAHADVSAIHYHFGSKHQLVASILEQRLSEMSERRAPLVEALQAAEHPTPLDVVRCLVGPTAERAAKPGRTARQREAFLAAVADHADFTPMIAQAMEPDIARYMAALQRALPGVPTGVLIRRLLFAISVVQRALTRPFPGEDLWLRRYGAEDGQNLAGDLAAFLTGALSGSSAPPH
jgi:AcrR family transcriptional regulator